METAQERLLSASPRAQTLVEKPLPEVCLQKRGRAEVKVPGLTARKLELQRTFKGSSFCRFRGVQQLTDSKAAIQA